MEKIEKQLDGDVIKHECYEVWRWNINDVADKLNELVEGYNKIMKRLERDKIKDYEEWKRCREQDIGLTYDDVDR